MCTKALDSIVPSSADDSRPPISSISSQRVTVRRKNDVILRIRHQDLGWCHGSLAERSGNQQCTFGRRHQLNGMENNSLSLKYLELLFFFFFFF
jgi:hypothetical protein